MGTGELSGKPDEMGRGGRVNLQCIDLPSGGSISISTPSRFMLRKPG